MAAKVTSTVASDEKQLEQSLSEESKSENSRIEQRESQTGHNNDIETGSQPDTLTEADKEAAAEPSSDPNIVTWDGTDDPNRPHNWTKKSKYANGHGQEVEENR
jgi:hypothetical protein